MRIIIILYIVLFMLVPSALSEGMSIRSVSMFPYSGLYNANVTISVVIDGGGQVVSGVWTGDGLPDGVKLSYPFEIRAENNIEIVKYLLLNQGSLKLYNSYFKVAEDGWNGAICDEKPKFCFPVNTSRIGFGLDAAFIVDRISSGSYARFGSSLISKSVDLVFKMNGTEYRQTIGSGQMSRGSVVFKTEKGERIGNAYWTGYSSTGVYPPNQDNYIATHLPGQSWKIAYLTDYEKYIKSLTETDTLLQNLDNDLVPGFDKEGFEWTSSYKDLDMCKDSFCSSVLNMVNLHNINYESLTTKNIQIGYGSPTSGQKTVIDNGNVIVTSKMPIGYSEIILVMSASQIGVVVSSGKPQIDNISITNYSSGDNTGNVNIGIRNIGSASGTFGVRVNGSSELKITLNSGSSGSVNIPVAEMTEGINYNQVEVYDINTGETATRDFQVNVSAPKNFRPNESEPYNGVTKKSDAAGMTEKEDIRCTDGIWQSVNGDYECLKLKDVVEPAAPKKELKFNLPVSKSNTINNDEIFTKFNLGLIIVILGLVILLIIGVGSRTKKKSIGRVFLGIIHLICVLIIIWIALTYMDEIESKIYEIQFIKNLLTVKI